MIAGLILKMSWALLMFSVVIIFNTVFSSICLSVNGGGVFVLLLFVFLSSSCQVVMVVVVVICRCSRMILFFDLMLSVDIVV